jgi:predicted anti-sigma-YlaC factor YlaD
MNCAEWREKIALFTGADLPADEAVAVEAHLSVCDGCRAFEQELSETRAMLLSMRTVDETDVAIVRSNVLSKLQGRPRRSVFAWMPYAAAAAVVVLMFDLAMWRTPAVEKRPLAGARGSVPAATSAPTRLVAETPKQAVRVAKRKPRVRPQPKPAAEPMVVTLFTDDPDVVIVWITD